MPETQGQSVVLDSLVDGTTRNSYGAAVPGFTTQTGVPGLFAIMLGNSNNSGNPVAPISQDETIRRTGLAWSAGIVFFASIAFTLFLGWLADLVLGSSPWGLVGGIVLGSIIGFIQFFRLTSQIFGSGNSKPVIKSLLSHDDDDN